jgi:hypothetical protein
VGSVVVWVLVVVWFAAVLGLSGWLWWRARRVGLDERRAEERRRAARDRRRVESGLERTMREAASARAVVVVARRGANPTRVTWSDGSVWFYFSDHERYLAARERGVAGVETTREGEAPPLGSPRPPT